MTISPFDPLRFPRYPLNNITPFTYRDGRTFLELIEALRSYISETVVPGVNANFDLIVQNYMDALTQMETEKNATVADIQAVYDAFMADVDASLRALNDDSASQLVADDNSLLAGAIRQRFERKNYVSVKDYGAVGDGVTDDTIALSNCFDAANAMAGDPIIRMDRGTYKTTAPLVTAKSIDGADATILYAGVSVGAVLSIAGSGAGAIINRRVFNLPRIVRSSPLSDGTIGVRLVNLNTCTVHIPFVQNFHYGLVCEGNAQGFVYNTINLGALWDNLINLWLRPVGTGWVNQNVFIGGRLQQASSLDTNDSLASQQILLGVAGASSGPNNNTFLNTSLEGNNPGFYRVACYASRYNMFINCRWENFSSESRILWGAGCQYNVVDNGYDALRLVAEHDASAVGNTTRLAQRPYISARATSGQTLPNGVHTPVSFNPASNVGAPYDAATQEFTLPAGSWVIEGNVAFAANQVGRMEAYLLIDGVVTQISQAAFHSGWAPTVRTSWAGYLPRSTKIKLLAYQDSGADLNLSTLTGRTMLNAVQV